MTLFFKKKLIISNVNIYFTFVLRFLALIIMISKALSFGSRDCTTLLSESKHKYKTIQLQIIHQLM